MKRAIAILALSAAAHGEPPKERFPDGAKAFQQAKELLAKDQLDDKSGDDDLYRGAVAGMLSAGGRWDKLLSPSEIAELKGDMQGEVVGVGVEIRLEPETGAALVLGVLPGSGAERAGLAAGDRILRIDGVALRGREQRDVVRAIRGKAGSQVALTVLRDDKISVKTVLREKLVWAPVTEATLPGEVALIGIRAFTEKTPALLREALGRAAARKPRALVIDLRDDEGGLFDKMIECAGALTPKGTLVVTKLGRGGRETPYRSDGEPLLRGVPTAVLVNGKTASGAEMLAGAMQSAGARVVGKRTFGKWNVQRIDDLGNGWAIKFTVGTFRSPAGALLDGKGLDPDLEVEMDPATTAAAQRITDGKSRLAADPQLRAALALLRV